MAAHAPLARKTVEDAPARQAATPGAENSRLNARPAVVAQRAAANRLSSARSNRTGLPDRLKAGVETLSGVSLDDVRVHRNSSAPAQMQAHAFAQGSDIHLAPGQEHHLPHEAWHVVQQKQGRVHATRQLKSGVAVNDDAGLEAEADTMGARALQFAGRQPSGAIAPMAASKHVAPAGVAQRAIGYEVELGTVSVGPMPGVLPAPALHKGMVLWRGAGWDVSIDEQGGAFDIEFRTDPVDDLASGGRGQAQSRLTAIANAWTAIEAAPGPQAANFFNAAAPANVRINNHGVTHHAQMQASAGLSMTALQAIRSGAAVANFTAAHPANPHVAYVAAGGTANAHVIAGVNAAAPAIRAALALPAAENIDQMLAVIGMIVELAANAHIANNVPYPKGMAGGLMARTNFVTILGQLPPHQRAAIGAHPAQWRQRLIAIALPIINLGNHPLGNINAHTPLFRTGVGAVPSAGAFSSRLKMATWFRDLAHGQDRLTAADYGARHPGRAEAAELESLGSYGNRMDVGRVDVSMRGAGEMLVGGLAMAVATLAAGLSTRTGAGVGLAGAGLAVDGARHIGTPVRNRPIFEFRALGNPDVQDVVNAGLAVWDYVEFAHGHHAGGANAMSLFTRLWNRLAS